MALTEPESSVVLVIESELSIMPPLVEEQSTCLTSPQLPSSVI